MICRINIEQYAKDINVSEEVLLNHFDLSIGGVCVIMPEYLKDLSRVKFRTFSNKRHRSDTIKKKYIIPIKQTKLYKKEKINE